MFMNMRETNNNAVGLPLLRIIIEQLYIILLVVVVLSDECCLVTVTVANIIRAALVHVVNNIYVFQYQKTCKSPNCFSLDLMVIQLKFRYQIKKEKFIYYLSLVFFNKLNITFTIDV
jgi:hypothetical protein